ncbi:Gamma-glutamylaminecyclotransferase [Plecturocebus cupreus]
MHSIGLSFKRQHFFEETSLPLCPMAPLFVYGTLKRGQPNHQVLRYGAHGSAGFWAPGCTLEPYSPVIAREHNIPWLLHLPGSGRRVEGEVFAVDEQMLRFLDDLENCPTRYQRTALRVQLLEDRAPGTEERPAPTEAQCFVYNTAAFPPEWTQLPNHDGCDSEGLHGLRYNPRENR